MAHARSTSAAQVGGIRSDRHGVTLARSYVTAVCVALSRLPGSRKR